MNFSRKTQLSSEIPTSSMPDIIFMLLIFFMVTTVLREYSGLPISLPKAKRIEKLKSKRHTAHVWVSKDGLISIEWGVYGIPETFVVKKNNIIDYKITGPIQNKDFQKIQEIIKQKN